MREVSDLIKAGQWHAPDPNGGLPPEFPDDWDWRDDGGMASSDVPRRPLDDSGEGSAALADQAEPPERE